MVAGTPGLDGGVPQVWMVGGNPGLDYGCYPRSGWWGGTWGAPWPSLDGWGVPQVWMVLGTKVWMVGGTPGLDGGGTSGLDGGGYPPTIRQNCIVSTCYLAGGMPLAFRQEDFLVV